MAPDGYREIVHLEWHVQPVDLNPRDRGRISIMLHTIAEELEKGEHLDVTDMEVSLPWGE